MKRGVDTIEFGPEPCSGLDTWLAWAAAELGNAAVDRPRRDARLLLGHTAGLDTTTLVAHPTRPLGAAGAAAFRTAVARRRRREPVSRIIGRREFWSLDFKLGPATLDPRPDSETLVEAALETITERHRAWRLLDLGCGSGCLLGALLKELPLAFGVGIDLDPAALTQARDNAAGLGLAGRAVFAAMDWSAGLAGRFDLIVCNPPYVPSAAIAGLEPEVRSWDPGLALDGGADGLAAYRRLVPGLPDLLAGGGRAIIEIAADQAGPVAALLRQAGLAPATTRRDLAGRPRCLVAEAFAPEIVKEK
ncbi:MAG: peptide chain release factor N(5)-glutamine methyltransferase [Alphaproteobacteria bacterium]|jgi:release factor glutamine methyltransferase|nr:peptide chain release factor N(5)-glutamine methyltransferase [Alphaproteobacteria bacterium]HJP20678.1 peptide chain release factor N(5)-glutamine methyltransferase [Alphaproteobacteria bacterium]